MKKNIFALLAVLIFSPLSSVHAMPQAGALVKGSASTVYYFASNGNRYAFSDANTYFSWFSDFSAVQVITDAELSAIPLRGLVTYRPGIRLVKIQSDPKVYAVDRGGTLRWISSEDAAVRLYGDRWSDVVADVPDSMFVNYTIGAAIADGTEYNPETVSGQATTVEANLGLPEVPAAPRSDTRFGMTRASVAVANDVLPEVLPYSPYAFHMDTLGGRTILRFSAKFWNAGDAPLQLVSKSIDDVSTGDDYLNTYQHILQKDGSYRDVLVGKFLWHAVHNHYHYANFADYILQPVLGAGAPEGTKTITQKTTFCMRDDEAVMLDANGRALPRIANGQCGRFSQLVSIGWADVYKYTLPDQYFDVNDLQAGVYRVLFDVDPLKKFTEKDRGNNTSATFIRLDPKAKTVTVMASASPFPTPTNIFEDGMLLRSQGKSEVYVMQANKKRLLTATEVQTAHGGETIYDLPNGIIGVLPDADPELNAVTVMAQNLSVPWDVGFLPDGDMIATERPGVLRRFGKQSVTIDIPMVKHDGEGGLMGLALHPDFATNHFLYIYMTAIDGGQKNRVVRFKFENNVLTQDKIIIDDIPSAIYHDGGQITFGPDGMLYLTTGDANTPALAQDLGSLAGKTLRLTPEGDAAPGNPFGTAVWSYGHRNAQGIAWDAQGRMWQTEHGRSGATSGLDELNLVVAGKNYGWPTIQGSQTQAGLVTPVANSGATVTWAPSGMAFVNGRLFFAGLFGESLYEATPAMDGTIKNFKAHLVGKYGRLRAVVVGSDGMLYVTTSNADGRGTLRPGDDKILKINPELLR